MGLIRQEFGKVTIETRSESFIVYYADAVRGASLLERDAEVLEVAYADLKDLCLALADLENHDPRFHTWLVLPKPKRSKP